MQRANALLAVLVLLGILAVQPGCARAVRYDETQWSYRRATGGLSAEEAEADRPGALLGRLRPTMTVAEVYSLLGQPHDDRCSGIPCPVWYFDNGTYVTVPDVRGDRVVRVAPAACGTRPCRRRCFFDPSCSP